MASKKTKDITPKKNPKGGVSSIANGTGSGRLSANDNLTLVRNVRPGKDLSPKKNPRGGKGAGGRLGANDNLTLVRHARPGKDLSPKKSPHGGKNIA